MYLRTQEEKLKRAQGNWSPRVGHGGSGIGSSTHPKEEKRRKAEGKEPTVQDIVILGFSQALLKSISKKLLIKRDAGN